MPLLVSLRSVVTPVKEDDLETILIRVARFGPPSLRQFTDGEWTCRVEMRVQAAGASFDIRSEFNCKTPLAAAKQCEERIKETLSKFGGQQ